MSFSEIMFFAITDGLLVCSGILLGYLYWGRNNNDSYDYYSEQYDDMTEDLTRVITTVGDTKHITINKTYKNKNLDD